MRALCSEPNCGVKSYAKGYCFKHYQRFLKFGAVGDGVLSRRPKNTLRKWLEDAMSSQVDECILWPFTTHSNGYGNITYGARSRLPHRLVCEEVHGKSPSKDHEVAHSCRNRRCCNPRHLRWATPTENAADKAVHGTVLKGSKVPTSKLCEDDVSAIRRAGRRPLTEIAAEYGVSITTVSGVLTGKTWKHVSGETV